MPPHRRIIIMAVSTGIIAALAASLNVEWMRYFVVILIGVVAALFWQVNEVREEAERRVVRAMSHHLNNSLNIVMNRRHLDPNAREKIVDEQVLRCVWAMQTILPALNVRLPELLNIRRHSHPTEWSEPDIEQLRQQQPPIVPRPN
jgi:hypothetical protein